MATITPATPAEWPDAFELAFQYLPSRTRGASVANALRLLAQGDLPAGGILVARDATGLAGVQVCVPLAGAGGLFWLPQVRPGANADAADALVQAGLSWIRSKGSKLAQALVPTDRLDEAAPLLRHGFAHVSRLAYFRHDLLDLTEPSPGSLRYTSYGSNNQAIFHATLLRTYEGTRDCPELNDRRTIEEIVAGHQAQGKYRPERWLLGWRDQDPVGVALATEMFDDAGWDLTYVGVVPEARGLGVGRTLTLKALTMARAAGAEFMILAVDVRNEPAVQLYESLGFEKADEREILLCFW